MSFRNQYDTDVSIWSPQGRIYQIEYAVAATRQGTATVVLKNDDHIVFLAIKRPQSAVKVPFPKIFSLDKHIGITSSGLTTDAIKLRQYLVVECSYYKLINGTRYPIRRLVLQLCRMMQIHTQRYDKRPFGAALLIAAFDKQKPVLFEVNGSANFYECRAMAIGANSERARAYLENRCILFESCSLNELIKHGLKALRECIPLTYELHTGNIELAMIKKDSEFAFASDEELKEHMSQMNQPTNLTPFFLACQFTEEGFPLINRRQEPEGASSIREAPTTPSEPQPKTSIIQGKRKRPKD